MTAPGGPAGVLTRVPAALSVRPPPPHCPFTEGCIVISAAPVRSARRHSVCLPLSVSFLPPSFPPPPFSLLFIKFFLRNHSIGGCFSFLGCEALGGLSLGP